MIKDGKIQGERYSLIIVLLFAAILLTWLAPHAAVNVDEQLHYPHAKKVVNWYFTGGADQSCLDTPVSNLKYYGQSVDNLTALINRIFELEDEFLIRHYTGAVFFWLLLLGAALLARQITGKNLVAAGTVLLMLAMPRLFGQAFGNLKDIPFATGYIWGILFIIRYVRELPKPGWKNAIALGLVIAFTSSVRIGGLILFAYLGLAGLVHLILKPFLLKHIVSTKLCLVRLLGQGLTIVAIGYFGGLIFWPYALQDVLNHPLESLQVMEHYKVSIRQVFEGEIYWSTALPQRYLVKWLGMSIPEIVWIGFILFVLLFFIGKGTSLRSEEGWQAFVLFAFLFPVIYVLAIHSNLYSGVRQMLFVLPALAVMASIGIEWGVRSIQNKIIRNTVCVMAIFLVVLPVKHQAATFPADYIYFNDISGGNRKAWSVYEYDYYFHGLKKPAEYIKEIVGDKNITLASNCNLSNYFEDAVNIDYKYTRYTERSSKDWDYGLFGINYIHPFRLKNKTWQPAGIVKTFYHRGNPIAIIIKRENKNDFEAIRAAREAKYQKADSLFELAVRADQNNVWLHVAAAQNCYNSKSFNTFAEHIEEGSDIHPYYEPLLFLKAQKLYDDGLYAEAMSTLNELIQINPRYKRAKPLLEATKNKLNKN